MAQEKQPIEIYLSIDGVLSKVLYRCNVEAEYDYVRCSLRDIMLPNTFVITLESDDKELYKRFKEKYNHRDVKSKVKVLVKESEKFYLEACSGNYIPKYEVEFKPNGIYELEFVLKTWGGVN